MLRRFLPPAVFGLAVLAASPARAAPPTTIATPTGPRPAASDMDKPHERRSGIVVGFDLGVGPAASSGYPNDVNRIDDPKYYAASGWMFGGAGSLFVMGAIADALSFGFFFGLVRGTNGDFRSTGGGGGFRVEAFPLYGLVPALRDLGVMARFGIGSANLSVKLPGAYPEADGVQSFLGVGVFHEWRLFGMLGGHVAAGPALDYDTIFSRSIEWHGATLGGRLVFYGGP